VFEVLEERFGKGNATLFARSATVGNQQYPVHWGGDSTTTFESMAETLRGGLSLGLSGFGFWSHDIGGFEQSAKADVYKRWCAFGLLSSHSRLHGSSSYRVPWLFDDQAVDVLRFFTRLKCRLMPYLFGTACQAHQKGIPVLRAMMLEFPDDPACDYLDRQYMLGETLLVAPVFSSDGAVEYYLPRGRWTNYLTGQVREGPDWVHETHNFLSIPLWVRPNSILPVGGHEDRPDYDYSDGVTLELYELAEGQRGLIQIPTPSSEASLTFMIYREGKSIIVERRGLAKKWQLLLVGIDALASVEGGVAESTPRGVRIVPAVDVERIIISLT
jgi:alpha-D-xyloside xylohydrolase